MAIYKLYFAVLFWSTFIISIVQSVPPISPSITTITKGRCDWASLLPGCHYVSQAHSLRQCATKVLVQDQAFTKTAMYAPSHGSCLRCQLTAILSVSSSNDIWQCGVLKHVITTYGSYRLVDTASRGRGRAEIYKNGQWGTLCDSSYVSYGWPAAFCRSMGFRNCSSADKASKYRVGKGTGFISQYQPGCAAGTQYMIEHPDCKHSSNPSCGHSDDVYVICQ